MTDYRFSNERPGRKLRPAFGLITSSQAQLVTRPLPVVVTPWEEPSYNAQTEEYGTTRLPIFVRKLDRVETESQRIDAELRNRSAVGTIVGAGEQAVIVMPIVGACPRNGPLAYVYDDLFEAAQRNLATLGGEKPPRYSPVDVIERWVNLIEWNISIARRASNIDGRFMFPETHDRVAESYRPASWGSLRGGTTRTLTTQQGGYGPGETPVYKEGLPYPHNNETEAIPQSLKDADDAAYRNLRSIIRLDAQAYMPSEQCFYTHGTGCSDPTRWPRMPYGGLFGDRRTDVGIVQSRMFPQRPIPAHEMTMNRAQDIFFTKTEDLNSGKYRFGSPSAVQRSVGGAWAKLDTIFWRKTGSTDALGRPTTGWYYLNAIYELGSYQTAAREWSRVSLSSLIADSIAWYIFNHNVWYAAKLGFTPEQLREQQRALVSAGLDRTSGPIVGATAAVGSAVNPIIGIVVGILNAIGKELLLNFIQIAPDMPKPLFLRIPDPEVCDGRPEEQAGAFLCPPGTTGVYPNCTTTAPPDDGGVEPEGVSPLVLASTVGAGLLLLWAVMKKKKGSLGDYDEDDVEEALSIAEERLRYAKWYRDRHPQDIRKGKVRFERNWSGDPSIVIDESFDCSDLNSTIEDLQLVASDLEEVYGEAEDPSRIEEYLDKIEKRVRRIRRLARANGCTTISGLKRTR